MGQPAPNYPFMQVVGPSEVQAAAPDIFAPQTLWSGYLIAKPLRIRSFSGQYSKAHYLPDLLRCIAIGCDLGVLSQIDAHAILYHQTLYPGGIELGFYPVATFLKIAGAFEKIALAFLQDLPVEKRTLPPESFRPKCLAHQHMTRPLSFCSERITSYLLEKEIKSKFGGTVPTEMIGRMHTVSDEEHYIRGV